MCVELYTYLLRHALILPGNPGHACRITHSKVAGWHYPTFSASLFHFLTQIWIPYDFLPTANQWERKWGELSFLCVLFVVVCCLGNWDCGEDQTESTSWLQCPGFLDGIWVIWEPSWWEVSGISSRSLARLWGWAHLMDVHHPEQGWSLMK